MASCTIRNKSIEALSLPYPLAGIMNPGQLVTIPVAAAIVLPYLTVSGRAPQDYEVISLPSDPASYPDQNYAGALLLATTGMPPASGLGTSASPEMADTFVVRVAFTALVTGTADDVTIFASNAPCKFRILDSMLLVTTLDAGATGTLYTATAAGGTQCSSALSAASLGRVRDNITTGTQVIAAGGSLYLRRSDRAFAGEIILTCEKVN